MTDTAIYFGRPGSLITIQHPRGGFKAPRPRPRTPFTTVGGGVRVGQLAGGKRTYTLSYGSLQYTDFADLFAYDQGHNGTGPFVLLDPGQRNQLTVNQSSATSETNSSDNFTVAGSGVTLTSSSTTYRRGPRAAALNFTYAASGSLTLDTPAPDWYGIPVASRPYVFSFYALGGGTDAIVTLTPTLRWYSTAGAVLSTSTGTPTATNGSTWTQMYVNATTPASGAYALCSVTASAATVSAGSIVYFDQFQFEEGSSPTTWRPGTGVMPVVPWSIEDQWIWTATDYRLSPVLILQEVGP